MGLLSKGRAYARVLRRPSYRDTPDLVRLLRRRPAIAVGVSAFETGLLASGRVEDRVKALAAIKTSALIGCPF